jgi:hypothetical protein
MNLHQFCMRCVCFLAIVCPVAALSTSFTIFWSTCTGPMCAGSVLDIGMLSGVTLRDKKHMRVFMQNFKRWYLTRESEQMRVVSTSLQIVPHLFRTNSQSKGTQTGYLICRGHKKTAEIYVTMTVGINASEFANEWVGVSEIRNMQV